MPPDEPPTNPGTPSAKAVATEVAAAAIEIRAGGWRAAIPATLVIALVTSLTSSLAVRASTTPPEESARTSQAIREDLSEVRNTQRQILERINAEADLSRNARAVDATEKASFRARLETLESRIR